jgi:hypothetical protein
LRWANDKYKGILAFRATLRSLRAEGGWHELFSLLTTCAAGASDIFRHSADRYLLFWRQTAPLQFSPDIFSCGTRQEHRYHLASVTTELNLAPRLLQLQSYDDKLWASF